MGATTGSSGVARKPISLSSNKQAKHAQGAGVFGRNDIVLCA